MILPAAGIGIVNNVYRERIPFILTVLMSLPRYVPGRASLEETYRRLDVVGGGLQTT